MKHCKRLLCLLLTLGLLAGCTANSPTKSPGQTDRDAVARAWLRLCFDGDFEQAYADCTPEVQKVFDEKGGLETLWQQIVGSMGEMLKMHISEIAEAEGNSVSSIVLNMENGDLTATVTVNEEQKIAGVYFSPSLPTPKEIEMPDDLEQVEITVDAGTGYPVGGDITSKKGSDPKNTPLIILLQGSGALDRHETVGAHHVFDSLAYGIAQHEISVLRFDKRTSKYSEVMKAEGYSLEQEYIEDALAAITLAKEAGYQHIFLLGHSLGATAAPRIAERAKGCSGLILMAGTPRGLVPVMLDQQELAVQDMEAAGLTSQIAQQRELQAKWATQYEALMKMTPDEAKKAGTVYELPGYYLYEMDTYTKSTDIIRQLNIPVLVMQGENDFQVYADKDYVQYQKDLAGYDAATYKKYAELNHIFMPSKAAGISEALNEYYKAGSIPSEVYADIANWVKQQ